MGFIANFKAKRAAKRAKAVYELELYEWDRENNVLAEALEIFEGAAKGVEPDDNSLVQKKGELVLWAGTGIYHEAGRTASRYVGGSSGFSIPIMAGIRYRVGSFKGQVVPGEEMQMDKDQGMVKITNQRLIFDGLVRNNTWTFKTILAIEPYENGIRVEKEKGKSPVFQTLVSEEKLTIILGRIFSEMKD